MFYLFGLRFGRPPIPPPPPPEPDPAIAGAIRMAKERRDKTAVAEHQFLADLDGDLVALQTDLGKKRIWAMRLRRAGTPNALLEQEVTDLEQKEAELNTEVSAHEAFLRATYPEYWRR